MFGKTIGGFTPSTNNEQLEQIMLMIENGEIGGGAITVNDNHFFVDNTARNAYFTSNPSQLVNDLYCVVGSAPAQLQQYQTNTWIDMSAVIRGAKGDQGDKGDKGDPGIQGIPGAPGLPGANGLDGEDGLGVPIGGTTGQVLAKRSNANNDTEWVAQTGGASGGGLPSTIIVAANNSSIENKALADYVCDGVNDEVQLQSAINELSTVSGKIILCNGDYYIDALQYSGSATYGYFGLMIGQPDIQREIIIEGMNRPTRKHGWENMIIGNSPVIWLNNAPYNSLGASDLCTILGSIPNPNGSFIYPGRNLCIKNIGFMLPSNQKKITCISAEFLSSFNWEGVVVSLNLPLVSFPYAVEGCIGIQGLNSKMTSVAYFGRESFIYGMWASYVINGEHFVGERLGTRFSIYPYIFGLGRDGVWGDAPGTHPNTLINCKAESCKNGPLFKSAGDYKGTVNFIDYIMEYFPNGKWSQEKFAVEEVIGQWGGLVNYAVSIGEGGDNNAYRNTSGNFWENGHGQNFRTRNIISRLSGITSVRTFMPNFLQEYYDTDYAKMTFAKVTGRPERDTLTIADTATSSGNVTITLGGVGVNVAIASGDTPSVIANKIANATYSGWFSSPTSNGVVFTNRNHGIKTAPSYSAGTTGATGSIVVTQSGTAPVWMDAVGATVA